MVNGTRAPWGIAWSAIWIGALAGLVAAVLFSLIGVAIGAHAATAEGIPLDLGEVTLLGLVWAVVSAFFAFVIAGWLAATAAGPVSAESGALHGAGAFLLATALLLVLGALGAGAGGWYAGLAPGAIDPAAAQDPARAARDVATAAAGAILIGLMGGVLGGWLGSGESMDWATATRRRGERPRRAA